MLGRMAQFANSPVSSCDVKQERIVEPDIEKELKYGVELVCEFNRKLSGLSWQAREIIQGWFRDRG